MSKGSDQQLIDRIAQEARLGRVSRREFMSWTMAAGLTASTASGLWTTTAHAQAPKRGGTFRWGVHDGNTSDTHDPGTYVTRQMIFLAHQYRSYLTMINPDNSLGPDLATEWSATPDAAEWTFKLNENATFAKSGNKVTAKDVVASINHHRGDKTTSAAKALLTDVTDVKADGDHAVVVTLARGIADLPWLMTDYHLAICPANDDGTIDWQSGDGCGPYKIDNGEFGVSWSLSRNEGWHGEGAYFDKVEMIILNDPNARQTALVTGDVDCISLVELKTLSLLERNPNIKVDNVPSGAAITMPMFCDTPPFNQVEVRNALKLAIDRNEVIEKIAFGEATIGNDFHHSPAMPYWPDDIPQREYDPDKARSLVEEADWASGNFNPQMHYIPGDPFNESLHNIVQQQYADIGINIELVQVDVTEYTNRIISGAPADGSSTGDFDILIGSGGVMGSDPNVTARYFDTGSKVPFGANYSHFSNARVDELFIAGRGTTDVAERKTIYKEIAHILNDEAIWVYMFRLYAIYGINNRVKGFIPPGHPGRLISSAHEWYIEE